ncbi:cysteine desulfurase family protein [Parasulfitobacter algicola]|uniref:Cysteine desulfurase n=1 Tax=Parasulfitobacter algicola TaxID=2614809 RepID=A0ABX2IS22_9RHOB|nr:cysteine desulfurase family protein [Sulfitobacter algicola]NSX55335.1 cysteine desulfurase [Sulfitobacter algicola]
MSRVYLDYNATAPLRVEAREAMLAAMDVVGNPSSVHAEGRAAKAIVEKARGQVAALVGCDPQEIIFTSGATEAAALVLRNAKGTVFVSENCHDCFFAHVDNANVRSVPINVNGYVESGWLDDELQKVKKAGQKLNLVAHSFANSETGILEQGMIRRAILDTGARLVTDCVQAVHRRSISFGQPWNSYAVLSAHKMGGPYGVGCLVVKQGIDLQAQIKGGGQEMGRRSGTENVIGVAGFGAAAEAAARDIEAGVWEKVEKLRNILESAIEAGSNDTIFVGKGTKRLPNTSCFATPGWKAETQVMQMDLAGFAISAGSACSSGKVKSSRVLRAMGYKDDVASSAVRVSLGPETTEQQVMAFADAWLNARQKQRARAA